MIYFEVMTLLKRVAQGRNPNLNSRVNHHSSCLFWIIQIPKIFYFVSGVEVTNEGTLTECFILCLEKVKYIL